MSIRVTMIGAGSPGFSRAVGEELMKSKVLQDITFVMMDIDPQRADASAEVMRKLVEEEGSSMKVEVSYNQREALTGANYVVTSCEKNRVPYWIQDIEIPEKHGCYQLTGENGGPGGQIHAMRNITIFMGICKDMREVCPDAWLMNFTNPMSFLCTYVARYGGVKCLGFCHQVHGSFGVIAEMLGFEPGELEVISGGVNHFNWLMDIRKKGTNESYMEEFLSFVEQSEWWEKVTHNVPPQKFTKELLELTGCYPIGYDDHIVEYVPFFYDESEWDKYGYFRVKDHLKEYWAKISAMDKDQFGAQVQAASEVHVPFPKDPKHPHYHEDTCIMIEALETNTPTYVDSINVVNIGAVSNLPANAIVDVPAICVGGEVRSIHVGALPPVAEELCRRQVTLHELVVEATVKGNRQIALQAMALDPYIKNINQAKAILDEFLEVYKEELPQFHS